MPGTDPTDIRAHERAEADRKAARDDHDRAVEADWGWLMSNQRGRRVVQRLLDFCDPDDACEGTNALSVHRALGRRDVGLWIQQALRSTCKEHYLTMMREHLP